MKGNIVLAAAVFAAGIIIASSILVLGIQSALNDAMLHLDASVRTHAKSIEKAGAAAGGSIRAAAESVEQASKTISRLQITIKEPVDIAQPIRIEGPGQDGSLPVDARLAK
jgi:hypothetical protein